MKKKSKIGFLLAASLLILTACGTSEVTANSSDFWEKLVYFFAEMIQFLSFNGSTGIGIILFTLIIRTVLLPVFQFQTTSSRKMQEVQPHIKKLQEKYPGKDMDSKTALGTTDPTFILPILAALFTFFSTWLSNKALPEKNGGTAVMTYLMPVLIFFFAVYAASGVALYWTVSNAYQVGQTLLLGNPFKIIAEREAKAKAERQLEMKKKRALQKAQKKKK